MAKKNLYFDITKCLSCRTCELSCALSHSPINKLFEAVTKKCLSLPRINVRSNNGVSAPVACRHCADPKCVQACIAGAIIFDEDKQEVVFDKDKCIGCWMCVMSCPYGAIRPEKWARLPLRCDHCSQSSEPECVKNCPTKAIIFKQEE